MHNILRTLSPQQKRKWPEHLPELVYAYNATIHSSTGYTPYFLMFGRDPTLPVDHLLRTNIAEENKSVDEYLEKHKKRLKEAMDIARRNLDENAERRRDQYNRTAKEKPLAVGARVLTRNRVQGRNKIQDIWNPTPYKNVAAPGNNVYTIQLADGSGPSKNVTRREIYDTGDMIVSDNERSTSDLDSDTDDSSYTYRNAHNGATQEGSHTDDDDEEETSRASSFKPRKTTRSTAGKHSNPHNLPRSAIRTQTLMNDQNSFKKLSEAVANLGATLGNSLGATLSQAWAQYNN
ncbi:hypothetical protein FSP39_009707 [Pinctada imbricata]|uniref:Uncharacterized protein n=1 Tax=Pinctada imbricata TaxID=66713 RepID=A0AA88YC18_PINIB|nr:hypothetical protein FSP39_009707 [Pinctada imbricata]